MAIGAIISVLITVIGISMLLLFVTQMPGGKKIYCDLLQKYTARFYEMRLNSFCRDNNIEHDISRLKSQTLFIDRFSDEHKEELLSFSFSRLNKSFPIRIDREIKLLSANLLVSTGIERKLKRFSSNEDNVSFPPFERDGGTYTTSINISKYVRILNASVDVIGDNYPGVVDIVFAIDTSGSMTEEWYSVCNLINDLNKNLTDLGVKNLSIRVYCIGGDANPKSNLCNSPYAKCKTGSLSKNDLKTVIPSSGFTEFSPSLCFINCGFPYNSVAYYHPSDDYREAWALAASFISRTFTWLNNSKKIIILIGDSDPTGGLQTAWWTGPNDKGSKWINDAEFTGNEEEAVQNAINDALANGTYVNIIFGDENPNNLEGYRIGCSPDPHDECCTNYEVCRQTISWMRQLSSSTLGSLVAYRDTEKLREAVVNAVMSRFPHDVVVRVGDVKVGFFNGELNRAVSPWSVNGSVFVDALQKVIDDCMPDDDGYCLVPVNVSSVTDGSIVIENLKIVYQGIAHNLSVELAGNKVFWAPSLYDEVVVFNFTNVLDDLKKGCDSASCVFNFTASVTTPTEILFSNLSVIFNKYFIREDLTDTIVNCWKKADFGRSEIDLLCGEFIIPSDYEFFDPISEADIADVLKKRQWCHIVGVSDFDCGNADNVDFIRDINLVTNVLVEYKANIKKVVVS